MKRAISVRRQGGFTLIEALIVLAVLAIIATLGLPALQNLIHRSKIEGITRKTASAMQLARLEAIKRNVPCVVRLDTVTGEVFAFADIDRSGDYNTDTDLVVGRFELPNLVDFESPTDLGADSIDGFANTDSSAPKYKAKWAVFRPDGSADDTGAFRFGDPRGNYLEVRVEPAASGRVRLRKWDGSAWRAQGEGGKTWQWN